MFVTIINDCRDQNALGRQATEQHHYLSVLWLLSVYKTILRRRET